MNKWEFARRWTKLLQNEIYFDFIEIFRKTKTFHLIVQISRMQDGSDVYIILKITRFFLYVLEIFIHSVYQQILNSVASSQNKSRTF